MIRRLRWKVVGLNMGMVFCVLLAVFAAVFLFARSALSRSVRQQLRPSGPAFTTCPSRMGPPCPASWRRSTPAAPSASPATATTT